MDVCRVFVRGTLYLLTSLKYKIIRRCDINTIKSTLHYIPQNDIVGTLVEVLPSVIACNPDLFLLNRFMTFNYGILL